MPSNYTPNYNLSQWEAGDRVQRADFNADNAKIDAALTALAGRIEYGTYVGNGKYGDTESTATVLNLGFRPRMLLVSAGNGAYSAIFIWPAFNSYLLDRNVAVNLETEWREDGLSWWLSTTYQKNAAHQLNESGVTYHYIALH